MSQIQKFHKGDLCFLATGGRGYLGQKHPDGLDVIIVGSYADQFGGTNITSFTVLTQEHGEVSWEYEQSLTLKEPGAFALEAQWRAEQTALIAQQSDLDWIFDNGPAIVEECTGSSASALAKCLGIENLWGPRGEGIYFHINSLKVLSAATPYLLAKDRQGWEQFCKDLK